MITAMINFSSQKLFVTISALEFLKTGKHFPKYVLPRNLLLPQEHDEFVDIPVFVALMLCNRVAVIVYK